MMNLTEIVSRLEWYDNSALALFDSCHMKYFLNKEIPIPRYPGKPGIELSPNAGMRFGTCTHAGLASFYSALRAGKTRQSALIASLKRFAKVHTKLFPVPDRIEKKHLYHRGVEMLEFYEDYFADDDALYQPVEIEIAAAVPIIYDPHIDPFPFDPFFIFMVADMIVREISTGYLWIWENKTTAGSVLEEANKLIIGRQTQGYYTILNQPEWLKPGEKIKGVIANILGVRVAEKDPEKLFLRNRYTGIDSTQWRTETIMKVTRIRQFREQSKLLGPFTVYDRRTEECFHFGRCPFYEICEWGLTGINWNKITPNQWNPLLKETL